MASGLCFTSGSTIRRALQRRADLHLVARTASIDAIDTESAPGGGSYTYARIEAEIPQEFDFRDFPFDRQRLTVRMEASETVEDLHFVPDHEDTDASDYLPPLGWTLDGISIEVQEHAYVSDFGYWTGRAERPGWRLRRPSLAD